MYKSPAQILGALAALVFMGWLWFKLMPKSCPGGVFVEFHPPLSQPGPFHFRLRLDESAEACEFDVPLPISQRVDTTHCQMAVELKTLKRGQHESIGGLTFAAAPKHFALRVTRQNEALYDGDLVPRYSPYPTKKEENKRFCGEQAFVQPKCVRGSSECAPFPTSCDGPEDCGEHEVCCGSPESARDYGKDFATECSGRRRCLERYGHVACHNQADCRSDEICTDDGSAAEFKPPLLACRPRAEAPH